MGRLGRLPGQVPKLLRLEGLPLPEPPEAACWPRELASDTYGDSTVAGLAHLFEEWEKLPRPD